MQCLAAISNKLSYIQLPPIQASQFYPNEIKLKARIFHFAMLKLTQKPPLTYGMVKWLVVLGTTKRQQQERQKQTSNRFNHMCKTRLNATQQKTTISSFFLKTQMLFLRIQIQENTPSSSKARQNNRDENWKDTNILFKKIPPAAGSQRTPRCSRRLQLNMTAISGWQFSGKLLKTLPKRLYIYIYIQAVQVPITLF